MHRIPTRPTVARSLSRLCLPLLLVISGWLGGAIRAASAQTLDGDAKGAAVFPLRAGTRGAQNAAHVL